ncbi:MAG TPA: DRTGG domain-containing protein [Clostridia bacterium]|nr:DRTGG domain-containing protein [Clostridia bacterium]
MTVLGLKETLNLTAFALPQEERQVRGGYAGDLLSWVMGKAEADDAWLTIMSNANIVAVALLTDVSCIILCEGVMPDAGVISLAAEKQINLLGSEDSVFALAAQISHLL